APQRTPARRAPCRRGADPHPAGEYLMRSAAPEHRQATARRSVWAARPVPCLLLALDERSRLTSVSNFEPDERPVDVGTHHRGSCAGARWAVRLLEDHLRPSGNWNGAREVRQFRTGAWKASWPAPADDGNRQENCRISIALIASAEPPSPSTAEPGAR